MTGDINISHYAPCIICKHLNDGWKCDAFPDGIPDDILSGNNDHSQKHEEQKNEILFERIADKEIESASVE